MKEEFLNNLNLGLQKAGLTNDKIKAILIKYREKIDKALMSGVSIENAILALGDIEQIISTESNPLLGKTKSQIYVNTFAISLPCVIIGAVLVIALAFCAVLFGIASVMYCVKAWSFPPSEQFAVFALAILFLVTCIGGAYATYVCVRKIVKYIIVHVKYSKEAIIALENNAR